MTHDAAREAVARYLCETQEPDCDPDAFENLSAPNWTRYTVTAHGILAKLAELGYGQDMCLDCGAPMECSGLHKLSAQIAEDKCDALQRQLDALTGDKTINAAVEASKAWREQNSIYQGLENFEHFSMNAALTAAIAAAGEA